MSDVKPIARPTLRRGRALLSRVKRSEQLSRLASATWWSIMSEAASRGLLFIAMVLVARHLGREEYGQFGLVRSTLNVFAAFGGMGLGLAANRFVSEYRLSDRPRAAAVIGSTYKLGAASGTAVGLSLLLVAPIVAREALRAPTLTDELRLAAVLIFLSGINAAQVGILQGLNAYKRVARVSLVQGLAAMLLIVGGAVMFRVIGAVGGLVGYTATGVVMMRRIIRKEAKSQSLTVDAPAKKAPAELIQFALPVMLAGVAIAPLKWGAEALLVRRVGFSDLGIFHAGMTVTTMVTAIVSTLNAPLLTLGASRAGEQQSSSARYATLYGSWFAVILLVSPLIAYPRLMAIPFGKAFASSTFYATAILLLCYVALMMYYQGIIRVIAVGGSMWFPLATNVVEGLSLVAGFLLLARFGAVGLAGAYVASYVARIAVSLPLLARHTAFPRRLLLDPIFLGSMVLFAGLVVMQLSRVL